MGAPSYPSIIFGQRDEVSPVADRVDGGTVYVREDGAAYVSDGVSWIPAVGELHEAFARVPLSSEHDGVRDALRASWMPRGGGRRCTRLPQDSEGL